MKFKKYEVQDWIAHPVTEAMMKHLMETYHPELLLENSRTVEELHRAKGILHVISILKKPKNFLEIIEEDDYGTA